MPTMTNHATHGHCFADLEIAKDPSFEQHLNKYPVIYLDLNKFVGEKEMGVADKVNASLLADISQTYTDVPVKPEDNLFDH